MTQESSPDVVQEALGLGALSYVVKTHAGREVIAAVEAVREGRLFVSAGVAGQRPAEVADKQAPKGHPDGVLAPITETRD